MTVLYFVLPLALLLSGLFVYVCVRAIQSGQFDDLETPGVRALFDDEPVKPDEPKAEEVDAEQ